MHGLSDWQLWMLAHSVEIVIGAAGGIVSVIVLAVLWRQRKGRK